MEKPIFVCGLARSGTTLVTHILNLHSAIGSFLYRDLPFVEVPYLWHFFGNLYYGNQPPKKREHGDEMLVDPDSPDAFEELLWKSHIAAYDEGGFCNVLDASYHNSSLEEHLPEAMNKVLYTRGKKTRYLSKGNYNLLRLHYILKLFADARIILCVRNPFAHAHSLARVHAAFMEASACNKYFASRLDLLGHYEFGPRRRVIRLEHGRSAETMDHWAKGENYLGYLLQWQDVYSFVQTAYGGNSNILWLDSASLLQKKEQTLERLLTFCHLSQDGLDQDKALALIKGSTSYPSAPTPYDALVQATYDSVLRHCA